MPRPIPALLLGVLAALITVLSGPSAAAATPDPGSSPRASVEGITPHGDDATLRAPANPSDGLDAVPPESAAPPAAPVVVTAVVARARSRLDPRIGAFTAGYVLLLALIGPVAVSSSERLARFVPDRWFPSDVPRPAAPGLEMDVGTSSLYQLGADLLQVTVSPGSKLHGVNVRELRLPDGATLGLVVRDGATSAPGPATRLQEGDVLLIFTTPGQRDAAERRLRAVHRSGRLARWRGDSGS